jgi:flagellar operon protein
MDRPIVNGVQLPFVPIRGVEALRPSNTTEKPEQSFKTVFQDVLRELHFSKHAQDRLSSRNISLNDTDMSHLKNAVDMAEQKGSQDSLVLLRDLAFIVNIKNRTVVTALDSKGSKDNVFTNIDSAVIAG